MPMHLEDSLVCKQKLHFYTQTKLVNLFLWNRLNSFDFSLNSCGGEGEGCPSLFTKHFFFFFSSPEVDKYLFLDFAQPLQSPVLNM